MREHLCRFCSSVVNESVVDLGLSPISNALTKPEDCQSKESFYPLNMKVCTNCYLVQLDEFERPEHIFSNDYVYLSSFSSSWLKHARDYVDMIVNRLNVTSKNLVVEIASNDGYLLKNFVEREIPVLGIEPAANAAKIAEGKGIRNVVGFFGQEMATRLVADGIKADLLIGNNVLAHVPDIRDFVVGMKMLLASGGTITMEFPHLLKLIQYNQYDTIYHEHFSYLSLHIVEQIFSHFGLQIYDVEEIDTHGGSLRIYGCHSGSLKHEISDRVKKVKLDEMAVGVTSLEYYRQFGDRVQRHKRDVLEFLIKERNKGSLIVGYGAPAKATTLLNYLGVRSDMIWYTVDKNPMKIDRFIPGVRVPIYDVSMIRETRPNFIVIFPWNLRREIADELAYVKEWQCKFVILSPEVEVF